MDVVFKVGSFYKDSVGTYLVIAMGSCGINNTEYVWYSECDRLAVRKITSSAAYELFSYIPVIIDWKDR